jgi:hypothetical protein
MITVMGQVAITTISQRERTTVVTDDGALAPALTLTGLISRRSHSTLALARVAERQLHELAHWSRVAGGVHIDSTEMDVDDGQYELRNVQTRVTPETGVSIGIVVSLTLVRLGGAGAGGNVLRRLLPQATLTANGFAVTSTPRYAMPVSTSALSLVQLQFINTADGNVSIIGSTSAQTYYQPAADHNKGEVKVWDTGGSATPGDWVRVFGPDHVFASPAHCAIDNGLVRLTPLATAGLHAVAAWDGTAWVTLTSPAQGDYVVIGSAGFVDWITCRIADVTPWRAEVQWAMSRAVVPWFPTKTYVVERGRPLAKLTVATDTAATVSSGIVGQYDYTLVKQTEATAAAGLIRDHNVEVAPADLALTGLIAQPMMISVNDDATVMAIMAGAALSGYTWVKEAAGGMTIGASGAVTSYTAWLGGVAYDATRVMGEAEAGTRAGTAVVATVAGASGGGSNNCVSLPALNDYVDLTGMTNPPAGSIVCVYARVYNSGVSASDSVLINLRSTASGALAGSQQTWTAATLGSAGTWKWVSSVATGWDGVTAIYPRVLRSAIGGGGSIYVDQVVLVTVSNGGYQYAQDLARAALTDVRVRPQTIRQVR